MTEPRIYIADLAAYNNGILHGIWVDATQDLDITQDDINAMLAASPEPNAEEYAIHDYDDFAGYRISEYESLQTVHEVALLIEEHGELGAKLLDYYAEIADAQKAITEQYQGVFASLEDYARQFTESCGEVLPNLEYYIDYKRMGRDFEMSGDIIAFELAHDEVHIFSGY